MNIEIEIAPAIWRDFRVMAIKQNKTVATLTAEVVEDAVKADAAAQEAEKAAKAGRVENGN